MAPHAALKAGARADGGLCACRRRCFDFSPGGQEGSFCELESAHGAPAGPRPKQHQAPRSEPDAAEPQAQTARPPALRLLCQWP